ncbi:RNA-binding protein YlmH, contains S4-like domain [Acetitomaculum ruminis DSM 5522]|uniref:RNA-binding protein YlmH, contains S4-like domain n=1 Tax=Acetitomaculum ruminis DSM 5522 TaxID=1120918 RepID=A0A1I0V6I5_9FIRM|nr:YlmH/Sll1252 family protein [Acetitomaculum ruminis]SFA71680.1 RNA-binding protein YlmH, contains S4-like domain [Acetitomaculum ruminis DSM 5522]
MNNNYTINHFNDLVVRAGKVNNVVYTDFLNLNEQLYFQNLPNNSDVICILWGGFDLSLRKMAAIIPRDYLYDSNVNIDFPFSLVKIEPVNHKFSDKLSHRDYLGALTSTGVDRSMFGDIIVEEEQAYYLCSNKVLDYVLSSIESIKRTNVVSKIVSSDILFELKKEECIFNIYPYHKEISQKIKFKEINATVSSFRLDKLVSLACKVSRAEAVSIINQKRVFINDETVTKNDYILPDNCVMTVRGYGKFNIILSFEKNSKDKYHLKLLKYI